MAWADHPPLAGRSPGDHSSMKFEELSLPGVWRITPQPVEDARGSFRRTFCSQEFAARGINGSVAQGNISENPHDGTLRGFHYQLPPHQEAKTITCITGTVFDIVLDLRPDSATFLKHTVVELSDQNRDSLHVPAGCANAWLSLRPNTTLHYYMSTAFRPSADRGIRHDDPFFKFPWPRHPGVISAKDSNYPDFDLQSFLHEARG